MKYVLPLKIDFQKSHGSFLFDKKSQMYYLDFFNMYSSLPLGYNHPIFDSHFKEKINEISYIRMANNVCESDELIEFVELFKSYTFSSNYHFTCTGALAVEAALKAAMHYKKINNPMVLSVKNSFHGVNSWGFTTSQVGITQKRMEYFPKNNWLHLHLDEIIHYLQTQSTQDIVAVLIEPIQATNGDIYLNTQKLTTIKELCAQNDICFILDEIQTGFGTTGKMWYYEHINLLPDILVFGKKAQVCGIVTNDKYSEILNNPYQKLDVTFDGELIDMVRATYILKAFQDLSFLHNVIQNSELLKQHLEHKVQNYRSLGYLIAFDFTSQQERDNFVQRCFENSLLINKAGELTVRLRPNLALTQEELELFLKKINLE
jgi:L-lysine 6-transaminase